jgi:AmmeMemoRadiSam system protein A
MSNEHPLVKLAKATIEAYVREQRTIDPPEELTPHMQGRAGAFVSLYDSLGHLRGCIGTIEPREPDLAREVIHNAISAATSDPRFPPVRADELDDLTIKVDVLTEPERIDGPQELDPRRYGVIVQSASDYRRGLLLPDLEGVDTVEYQVDIARRKAGIGPNERVELYRFEVKRYT